MTTDQSVVDRLIQPKADILTGDPDLNYVVNLSKKDLRDRWLTERGREIIQRWESSGYSRDVLDDWVGKFHGHTDLRGIDLSGKDLTGRDLSNIDMYAANLENASLKAADLTDTYLSEANVSGTIFDWAKMQGVFLDNVEFNHTTSFLGVDLNSINFNLAALLQEVAIGQQRIEHLKRRQPFLARILWITCDYGRSFSRFLLWCAGIIVTFALMFWLIPNTTSSQGFWESVYFSIITFTTLGYVDLVPVSWIGRTLVVTEVLLGYAMSGLLIAILARKVIGQ